MQGFILQNSAQKRTASVSSIATQSLPNPSSASTCLYAYLIVVNNTGGVTTPTNWTLLSSVVNSGGTVPVAVYVYVRPNNPGGINNVTFNLVSGTGTLTTGMLELSGVSTAAGTGCSDTAANGTATSAAAGATSLALAGAGATTAANELVIAVFGMNVHGTQNSFSVTLTHTSGYNAIVNNQGGSLVDHGDSDQHVQTSSGTTPSDTLTVTATAPAGNTTQDWAGVLSVFKNGTAAIVTPSDTNPAAVDTSPVPAQALARPVSEFPATAVDTSPVPAQNPQRVLSENAVPGGDAAPVRRVARPRAETESVALTESAARVGAFFRSIAQHQALGLGDRSGVPQPGWDNGADLPVAVALVNWSDLQPNLSDNTGLLFKGTGGVGKSGIDACVTWAQANNGFVKIRVMCGINAPDYVKSLVPTGAPVLSDGKAALPLQVYDQSGGNGGNAGPFWDPVYRACTRRLAQALQAYYGSVPVVVDMATGYGGTVFAEPCIRQFTDGNNAGWTSGVNAPTIASYVVSGYTSAADQTALANYIVDAAQYITGPMISHAFNPYNSLTDFDIGTGFGWPVSSITATTITVTGSPGWSAGRFAPGAGQNACAFVHRGYFRPDSNPGGSTKFVDASMNFATWGVQVGDTVWYANHLYAITSISTTTNPNDTLNVSGTVANNVVGAGTTIAPFWILPATTTTPAGYTAATAPQGGFTVTTNASGSLTTNNGAAPTNYTNVFVIPILEQNQESVTYALMQQLQTSAGFRAVFGNNSIKYNTNLQPAPTTPGSSLYYDLQLFRQAGYALYFQTAADAGIGGGYSGTGNALDQVIQNAIAAQACYLELPTGYSVTSALTATTTSGSTITAPFGGTGNWTKGAGMYGWVTFTASGNTYLLSATTSTTGTTTTPLAGADVGSNLAFTVFKWDYLAPARTAVLSGQLLQNATSGETLPGITDLATEASNPGRALSDTIGPAVSVGSRAGAWLRPAVDSPATATDASPVRATTSSRPLAESVGPGQDSGPSTQQGARRAIIDTGAVTDGLTRTLRLLRAPVDTLGAISDSLLRHVALSRAFVDASGAVTDVVRRAAALGRAAVDSLPTPTETLGTVLALIPRAVLNATVRAGTMLATVRAGIIHAFTRGN